MQVVEREPYAQTERATFGLTIGSIALNHKWAGQVRSASRRSLDTDFLNLPLTDITRLFPPIRVNERGDCQGHCGRMCVLEPRGRTQL